MESERTKLNHRVIIKINEWTHEQLKVAAGSLGIPDSTLARALVNNGIKELLTIGLENICFKFQKVEIKSGRLKK